MSEKIEWYKEVLELEPNSKVFLPLARLLVEENKVSDSINILQEGLRRHPEFLEARLFLVEVLYKYNRRNECNEEINILAAMFKKYAGFWQAWAACLESAPKDDDTASVMRFLAVTFMHGPVSFHEVVNRGLATYLPRAQTFVSATMHESRQKEIITAQDEKLETDSFNDTNEIDENFQAPSISINVYGDDADGGDDEVTDDSANKQDLTIDFEDNEDIPAEHFASLPNSNNETTVIAELSQENSSPNFEEYEEITEIGATENEITASLNTNEEYDNSAASINPDDSGSMEMAKEIEENEKQPNLNPEKMDLPPTEAVKSENYELENINGLGGESFQDLFEDNAESHPPFDSDYSSLRENFSHDALLESSLENEEDKLSIDNINKSHVNQEDIEDNDNLELDTSSEPYSIRTRSMADVLADQEDYNGALVIYRELLDSASDQLQRQELLEKIEAISRKLEEAEALSTHDSDSLSQMISSKSKDKLISMLETLARRVEARSRG